jgi:hypothetical protein
VQSAYSCYTLPALRWGCSMDKPLDIFRIVPEGVRWMGSVEDLEGAKALIKVRSAEQAGDFLVVSIDTGWKMEIKAVGTAA